MKDFVSRRKIKLMMGLLSLCLFWLLPYTDTVYASIPFEEQGTIDDPFLIQTEADLTSLSRLVNMGFDFSGQYFKQIANITLTGQWTPIGDYMHPFRATYNGDGYKIQNLTIGSARVPDNTLTLVGLFGNLENASIENVNLENVSIYSKNVNTTVGGIAAKSDKSYLRYCSNGNGIINTLGSSARIGGIVGIADNTTYIEESYNSCSLVGGEYVGGIAEYIANSTFIKNCYNSADIRKFSKGAGGIVNEVYKAFINDCYNIGNVENNSNTTSGGVVAYSYGNEGVLQNNYFLQKGTVNVSLYGIANSKSNSNAMPITAPDKMMGLDTSRWINISNENSGWPVLNSFYSFDAPIGVGATAGEQGVTVFWSPVSGATEYQIYTRTAFDSILTPIASTTSSSMLISSFPNGSVYYFTVRAMGSGIRKNISAEVSATPYQMNSPSSSPVPAGTPSEKWIYLPSSASVYIADLDMNIAATHIGVKRSFNSDNTIIETISLDEGTAKLLTELLIYKGKYELSIILNNKPNETVITRIELPKETIKALSERVGKLYLETGEVKLMISGTSLLEISRESEDGIYFEIRPVARKEDLAKRAKNSMGLGNYSRVKVSTLGIPININTNVPSTQVLITLPISEIELPVSEEEKDSLLSKLDLYVEHSEADTLLMKGELVKYGDGVGISYNLNRFGTLAILQTEDNRSSDCWVYKIKSPEGVKRKGTKYFLTVKQPVSSVTFKLQVDEGAVWKLYSNRACTRELKGGKLALKVGTNQAYIKVTAENGEDTQIYTVIIDRLKTK